MVVSRPCVPAHKPHVIVASIERVRGEVPRGLDTLEKVVQFLEVVRDGDRNPDRFYLGQQVPNWPEEGRFFARLDSLHTLKVPSAQQLSRILAAQRIATLCEDFRHDLHRRIFSAFASLGFDDYGWYPERDLAWIIAVGRQELSAIESDLRNKEAEIARNSAAGNEDWNQKLRRDAAQMQERLAALRSRLDPFEQERHKRGNPGDAS